MDWEWVWAREGNVVRLTYMGICHNPIRIFYILIDNESTHLTKYVQKSRAGKHSS